MRFWISLGAGLPALAAGLALAGCAGAEAEPAAGSFLGDHAPAIERAAQAVRGAEQRLASLPGTPTKAQMEQLEIASIRGRRRVAPASEWGASENGEEENTSQAESEISEGAAHILNAMSALRSYAHYRRPAARAQYETQIAHGREQWNSAVTELWHLARRSNPPTI